MNDISKKLSYTASIVKTWQSAMLPNGKTLGEQLTVQDICLWDIFVPNLVLYYIPPALANNGKNPNRILRPHISRAKHSVINWFKRNQNSKRQSELTQGQVLFMGFSQYMYRDVLHPVSQVLHLRGLECITLHDDFGNKSRLRFDLGNSQSIWDHWSTDVEKDSALFRKETKAAINDLINMRILPEITMIDGQNVWHQIEYAFNLIFNFDIPLLIPQIALAKAILNKHKPTVLISPDVADLRIRIYALLGRQMGIPLLEVQFGPTGAEGVEWQFFLSDMVATWGKETKDALKEHGVEEERIVITGSPRHDDLADVLNPEVLQTRNDLKIPEGYSVVLCASTYHLKEYNSVSNPDILVSMKRAVFDAVGKVEKVCLIVKPHPLENVEETKALIGTGKNIILVESKSDIRKFIKASDAFVGFGSTATFDALIGNKFTICPVFEGWIWSDPFVETNAIVVPRSPDEVLNIFEKISDGSYKEIKNNLNSARQHYLERTVYNIDGKSAQRVAQLAVDLSKQPSGLTRNNRTGPEY